MKNYKNNNIGMLRIDADAAHRTAVYANKTQNFLHHYCKIFIVHCQDITMLMQKQL